MGALGAVAMLLAHAATAAVVIPGSNEFSPTITGSDEFTGPAGTPPNPAYWNYDVGGGGWGNNELQVYTNSTKNASLNGKGDLAITALRSGTGYTSARLTTQGKFAFTYGLVEASIKMPAGEGLDSAFWSLGSDLNTVGWPQSGEIDMAEYLGNLLGAGGGTYHIGLHGPLVANPSTQWQVGADPSIGTSLSAGFHTYWIEKAPGSITVGIDGITEGTITSAQLPAADQWVFNAPSNLLLDVAVGGNYEGPVQPSTKFPATMLVDYVRYYAYTGPGATATALATPAAAGQPAAVPAQPVASPAPANPVAALGSALAALSQQVIQALVTVPMTALSNVLAAMGSASVAHTSPATTTNTSPATTTNLVSKVDAPVVHPQQPTTQTPAAPAGTPTSAAAPKTPTSAAASNTPTSAAASSTADFGRQKGDGGSSRRHTQKEDGGGGGSEGNPRRRHGHCCGGWGRCSKGRFIGCSPRS